MKAMKGRFGDDSDLSLPAAIYDRQPFKMV
jgi:hypothetical protein